MMNRLHHRKNWSHSEAPISAALSADSYHLVLETAPPDYVEKISRYLASSVGHSKRDPESTDSDSGDSLFITQNKVPEAVRSQRRCHSTQRAEDPTSHTELEDSEDSCREDGKEGRRKKQKLPIYSFPFHKKRERKDRSVELSVQDNIKIHYAGMGGFFHSVKELWQNYQDGDNLESSLPTVDMDGEEITPLSEEGERSDHEDIKVVEKNRFVVSCKAKRRQIWKAPQKRDNQMEQQRKRRRGSNATQETSPRKQRTDLYKTTTPKLKEMVSSSDSDSMDNGESSHRVQAERRRSNKLLKSRRKIVYQTPPPSSTNSQKVKEGKLRDDSDATKQAERMQQDREISSTTVTADVCHMLDLTETEHPEDEPGAGESQDLPQRPPHLIKDSDGNESSIKKRKKKKEKHGDEDKETEAQQAVTSEDVVMADAESPAPQAADEPELNENNQTENSLRDDGDTLREEDGEIERELPLLKQKKKKRKKNKAAVENSEQEDEVGHLECHVSVEEEKKKKKKKRERNDEDEEDVEQLSSGTVAESLNDAETLKQKKKMKKEKSLVNTEVLNSTLDQVEEHESCLESNEASQETLDSSYVKKKKQKKKKQSCLDATEAGGEDDAGDVSMSNDAATPAGKKKKKKKRKGSGECEEDSEQLSSSAVTEPDAEIQKKKKKKSLVNTEEVLNSTVDQVGEPESCLESNAASQETLESSYVKKKKKQKKKKQSCLDATEAGGEEVIGDVSMSNDAATPAGKKKKKKKISICDGTDVSLEGTTGDKDAELVSKKKKKKKKEILSRNMSEDTEAQSHDSVSVREKEKKKKKKKKASSFLAADAEGNCAQTHQDKSFPSQSVAVSAGDFEAESAETAENVSVTEFNGEVRKKKKKKKKTSDKDSERNFEEQNETSQSDLPETTDVTVKRKKKRRREESESVTPPESVADAGCLEIDEAVVVKKKKKKKIKRDSSSVIEDAESEISTQTSHKKQQTSSPLDPKSKHSAESSHDNRKSEQDTKDTHLDVPGNDVTPKKKKKKCSSNVLPEGKSVVKAVEVEPQKERNKTSASPRVISSSSDSPSCFKMSSSDSIKNIKAKKTLYNPSGSFLT